MELPEVAGNMERTLDDFERACRVKLLEEQEKILPDNSLISVLCDAVRLKREQKPPTECEYCPKIIDERDRAEDALTEILALVHPNSETGWSNAYGYQNLIADLEEKLLTRPRSNGGQQK